MDTIDKILQQTRYKEHDVSIGENLMAPRSADQLQATVAFPDEKVIFYQWLLGTHQWKRLHCKFSL